MNTPRHLLVSTRKGLFVLTRGAQAWQIERTAFLGDKVTLTGVDPRDGSWYAALDLGHFGCKLHRSTDQGRSWNELAVPTYAAEDTVPVGDGKPELPATLKLIWAFAAGGANEPGRLWLGTSPGGLFRSDDHGQSWELMRALWDREERKGWFGGGYDAPGIHSICVDPRDATCLRVAISCGGVWLSDDSGNSFRLSAEGMRAEYMPPDNAYDQNIQDPHLMVQCQSHPDTLWVQHHNGIFRSDDGAAHWHEITNVQPSVFGFAVAVHPTDPNKAWFVPAIKDQLRIPVNGELVVTRTSDAGKSFEILRTGLPQKHAYDLIYRHGMAIDATGNTLAIGSTTGGLWVSEDQGERWQAVEARLPPVFAVGFG